MKKKPRKIKQWAEEVWTAYMEANSLFERESPDATPRERLGMMAFAVPLAANNRGITQRDKLEEAHDYVLSNMTSEIQSIDGAGDERDFSILFPLAYLDAMYSLGEINEQKIDDVMGYIIGNHAQSSA